MTLKKQLSRQSRMELERTDDRLDDRAPIVYSHTSIFNVPEAVRLSDPAHRYSFIPIEAGGRSLKNEYDHAYEQRHFRPVLGSECPQLARRYLHDPFGRATDSELIIKGGQVLMKRTVEAHEEELSRFDEQRARHNYIRDMNSQPAHNVRMWVDDRKRAQY